MVVRVKVAQMKKVWLVTGSASGLGRYIVEAALAAGHQAVGSSRRPEELADLVALHGQNLRAVQHRCGERSGGEDGGRDCS